MEIAWRMSVRSRKPLEVKTFSHFCDDNRSEGEKHQSPSSTNNTTNNDARIGTNTIPMMARMVPIFSRRISDIILSSHFVYPFEILNFERLGQDSTIKMN